MAYSFIQSATGVSVSGTLYTASTGSANFTGADTLFLIVVQSHGVSSNPVISDSVGTNDWGTPIILATNTLYADVRLYCCPGADVSSSMTVTATAGSDAYFGLVLLGFSGGHASPNDHMEGNSEVIGASSMTAAASDLTASSNDCVIIAGMGPGFNQSIDDGFTVVNINNVASESWGASGAYLIQTTAETVNPTFTWGFSSNGAAVLASFKPAAVTTARRLILATPT